MFTNVQLVTIGLLVLLLSIPPALTAAMLPSKQQTVTVGLLASFRIPPPKLAVLPMKSQLVTVGLLPVTFRIPPPRCAELFVNMQSVTIGLALVVLSIPPPVPMAASAMFPMKSQFVTVGLQSALLCMPAPNFAVLPVNEQSSTVGLLPLKLPIPPPFVEALLFTNVQLVTVGLLPLLFIPPPKLASPPVIVKPSSTVSRPSPEVQVTTVPASCASIVVTSRPAELRTVIALPRKLMVSKYVPGATTTSSVSTAASMAAWMLENGTGTLRMSAFAVNVRATVTSSAANRCLHIAISFVTPDAVRATAPSSKSGRRCNEYSRLARLAGRPHPYSAVQHTRTGGRVVKQKADNPAPRCRQAQDRPHRFRAGERSGYCRAMRMSRGNPRAMTTRTRHQRSTEQWSMTRSACRPIAYGPLE